MKKGKIIVILIIIAVILSAAIIWFEIPRIKVRNYIRTQLPEGHYTLFANCGEFITINSMKNQNIDKVWHVYDKDRNVHFNIALVNKEENIETSYKVRNKNYQFQNNYVMNFVSRYWASLTYDNENDYQTKLSVQFVPCDNTENYEIQSASVLYGEFNNRTELDELFDDLHVATQFFEDKQIPLSYGSLEFRYTNYEHYEKLDEYSYIISGRLDDVEKARTEAYNKMIDIGMEYNDDDILMQFTEQELNAYVTSMERIG